MITLGSETYFLKFGFQYEKLDRSLNITNAAKNSIGVVNKKIICDLIYGNVKILNAEIFLVENTEISYPLILGVDVLRGTKLIINNSEILVNTLHLSDKNDILEICGKHDLCQLFCDSTCLNENAIMKKYLKRKQFIFYQKITVLLTFRKH